MARALGLMLLLVAGAAVAASAQSLPDKEKCRATATSQSSNIQTLAPCASGPSADCCKTIQQFAGKGAPLEGCLCYPDLLDELYSTVEGNAVAKRFGVNRSLIKTVLQSCSVPFAQGTDGAACPAAGAGPAVSVTAPGTTVGVGAGGATSVTAPGATVGVTPGGATSVTAPGTNVATGAQAGAGAGARPETRPTEQQAKPEEKPKEKKEENRVEVELEVAATQPISGVAVAVDTGKEKEPTEKEVQGEVEKYGKKEYGPLRARFCKKHPYHPLC